MRRSRWRRAGWIAVVIAAGLASRSRAAVVLPDFIAAHAGDMLWALMVFLMLGFAFPGARSAVLAALAVGVSFAVEFSQLVQLDWLDQLRATRAGALVLGRGFLATDLLCYLAGVALGVAGERAGWFSVWHARDRFRP